MKPFKEVIDGIRKAVMASEVREDIAQMGEYVEQLANTAGENIKKAIDPTLSVSGKAADAAKVGEAINAEAGRAKGVEDQIKEDLIFKTKPLDDLPSELEKANLNVTDGAYYVLDASKTGYVPTLSTSLSFMACAKVNVQPNESYILNAYAAKTGIAYIGFANSDGEVISFDKIINTPQHIKDYEFSIPNHVKQLYINGNSNITLYKEVTEKVATIGYVNRTSIIKGNDRIASMDNDAVWNDNTSIVDMIRAYYNSLIYDKDMTDFRVPLSNHFSHISYIKIINSTAFITMMRNDTNTEDSSASVNTYVTLTIFNLETNEIIKDFKVCGYNSVVGNQNVISGCAALTILSLSESECVMQCAVKLTDEKWHTIIYTYDIKNSMLSNAIECNIISGTNKYTFTSNNFSEHVATLESTDLPVMCTMTSDGTKNYGMFMCYNYLPSGVVMTTKNYIDYEYSFTPDINTKGIWECNLHSYAGYLFYALRETNSGFATLAKIDPNTYSVIDTLRIADAGSRLDYYENNGKLYLIHSICNRNRTEILEINIKSLSNSGIIAQPTLSCVYPSVQQYGDWCYITSTNNKSTRVYIRRYRKDVMTNLKTSNQLLMLLESVSN
uniref:Uncharacterized protein n=1 Tax=virus sp. ct6GG30 TaxID=2825804 RepID=A0A8S5RKN3_9VIRU|nr:MAG TPA: hypothetical protein [virus sp. ct6GG30]